MIAQEGRLISFLLSTAVIVLHFFFGLIVWPLWGVVMAFSWLYRDPIRKIPSAPLGLVSPADAQVISVGNQFDPFLKRESLCVSLQMNWYGVFALRAVTEGKIMQHWLHRADDPETSHMQHVIWIQTDEKDDVVLALHAGGRFNRMHCYVNAGERIGQGKRCGFVPFGTRIEVYLPKQSRTTLAAGTRIYGGSDLIGEFVH